MALSRSCGPRLFQWKRLTCGSLALSLKAQTKTSDEHVTPKTVPGRNGKIAFTSTHDGVGIYTIEADGSNQTRLTNPGYGASPKWSPDGTKIAFVSSRDGNNYEIYVMNADGTNQTRLTNNLGSDQSPEWSPDGTRLVFQRRHDDSNTEIYVMNADGTNQTRLTNNSGHADSPRWSPDGTKIAFHRSINLARNIYVMSADGSNHTQLTNSGYDFSPRWSPDSSRITFTSIRDEPSPSTCNICNVEIYVMNADGTNQTRLTTNPRLDTSPEWSPDGTRILFRSLRDNNVNIYVMNADGTSQTRLTNITDPLYFDVVSPIFSPDGTRIVFLNSYTFVGEVIFSQLYVMNADGSNLVRLTNVYEGGELDWQALPLTSPSCPNPIDCAEFFVRQQYRDFLNREPDAGGLAYWTNEITRCGSDARCIHDRRIGVSGAFFVEPEFQETGYFVDRLYQASFGHPPTFAQFNADRALLTVGPNLETTKQALTANWVERTAFKDAYSVTLSPEEFVNKLFDSANLRAYTTERQQLATDMRNGKSRAQVLRDVIEIPEFKTRQYNPAFVLMQYFGYLRRNVDQGGYDFWLDVLNNRDPNNYPGMICSFITSREYQERFGSTVTRSNADCGP